MHMYIYMLMIRMALKYNIPTRKMSPQKSLRPLEEEERKDLIEGLKTKWEQARMAVACCKLWRHLNLGVNFTGWCSWLPFFAEMVIFSLTLDDPGRRFS